MSASPAIWLNGATIFVRYLLLRIEAIARYIAPPLVLIALVLPFLRSGLMQWDSFLSISTGTQFLFEGKRSFLDTLTALATADRV